MSSDSHNPRASLLRELAQELRRLSSLGASLYRTAAGHLDISLTDIQVIDLLQSVGAATAGQLAEHLGLTTGAIAAMLNRLEEAGLVQRERDPLDGRRVVVRLVAEKAERHAPGSLLAPLGQNWEKLASQYDDAQIGLLLEFLKGSNTLTQREIVRLREDPTREEGIFAAPLGELKRGQLLVFAEASRLRLRAEEGMRELYRARFEGAAPKIKARDGVVNIRYPRSLLGLVGSKRVAEIALNAAIPWTIAIQGGGMEVDAQLGKLQLDGLTAKGDGGTFQLELPVPAGRVPIALSGGGSAIVVRRPAGVAARVHFKGWASAFVFDEQTFSGGHNAVQAASPGYEAAERRYEIDVSGSASTVSIVSDEGI